MQMLNRYLQAVGQYLPAETKDDTLAELRANLLAQMDAREEEMERPLTEAEISDILKSHGKPEVVALRYLPQRSLIGPTIFPFYLFTLKRALPLVILIYAAVRGTLLALSARSGHLAVSFAQLAIQFVPVLFTFWAVVTLVFAAIERGHKHFAEALQWNQWDPESLPALHSQKKTPTRTARVADAIGHSLGILYVAAIPHYPFLILGPGAALVDGVTASVSMHTGYFWLLNVMGVQLALKLFDLGRQPRVWLEIAVKALSVVILGFLWSAKVYFVPSYPAIDLAWLNDGFNIGCALLFLWSFQDLARLGWKAWQETSIPRTHMNGASLR